MYLMMQWYDVVYSIDLLYMCEGEYGRLVTWSSENRNKLDISCWIESRLAWAYIMSRQALHSDTDRQKARLSPSNSTSCENGTSKSAVSPRLN